MRSIGKQQLANTYLYSLDEGIFTDIKDTRCETAYHLLPVESAFGTSKTIKTMAENGNCSSKNMLITSINW